ncbi:hypothetical protein ABG067_000199 [Albugo candida]
MVVVEDTYDLMKEDASGLLPMDAARNKREFMDHNRRDASYLFKYLILTQVIIYFEAGAIPCLLDELSVSLQMSATEQGALGGVVYLALSIASPFGAFCLHHFDPKHILGLTLIFNNLAVLVLACTPTKEDASTTFNVASLMIAARALIGFTQAFPCIYTPLWVDEYAPREQVATWMSYLQGSVPMGVMLGYLLGTVSNWIGVRHYGGAVFRFAGLEAWRWPFIVQFVWMCPIMIAVFFIPSKHLVVRNELDFSATTSCSSESGVEDCESSKLLSSARQDPQSDSRIPESNGEVILLGIHKHEHEHEHKLSAVARSWSNRHDYMTSGRRHHERRSRHVNSSDLSHICGRTEGVSFLPTPPTSRTSSRHDEEDALLASAGMYGSSSQRGMRQLVANQRHHYNQTELDSRSPTHRSFSSGLSRTNPVDRLFFEGFKADQRGSQQASDTIEECTSSKVFDNALSSNDERGISSTASSNYGALDIISGGCSPVAQAFEDEVYERYPVVSLRQGFITLMQIPVFGLIVFGLTAVYFVVTGVQYWSTIFMIKSLHASKHLVNVLFVFVAGTGPIMGVFFGGWLVDRYGGYLGPEQRAKALGICMVLGVIAFVIASITTFLNDIYVTALFLWLLLFFGGSILPACTGIFISVVPPQYRALASSLSVMIFNLFGYSLSPYLTGWIMEAMLAKHRTAGSYFEYCDEACAYRLGFRFCLLWSVWSFLCIGSAWTLAKRDLQRGM